MVDLSQTFLCQQVVDFVERTLYSLRQHWAERIKYDFCFLCPTCGMKKLLQDCLKRKSLQCGKSGLHSIPTAAVKSKFGMSEEGVESGNKGPMMCRRSSTGQAGRSATLSEQPRTQTQTGGTNTINASGASNVSGNNTIGQQTNSYPSAKVVHHHHITTNVNQASPARLVNAPPKRQANTIPGPATKRQKVTESRPSTSKGTTFKPKKCATSQRKSKAKSPGNLPHSSKKPAAPKASRKKKALKEPKKKAPKRAKKNPKVTQKKAPKANQPKTQKSKTSQQVRPKKKSNK